MDEALAMMKKLLFIAPFYPPQKYPRAIQISHFVNALSREFEIQVLTLGSKDPQGATDEELLTFTSLDNVVYAQRSFLSRFVAGSRGDKFKKALLPDYCYFEHFNLYNKAKEIICALQPDAVFTFGQPMSTHLVGLKIKKKSPHIQWIAHFSDPWVDNPFEKWNTWGYFINKSLQDKVFTNSDRLVFTSQETVELVGKNYSEGIREKMCVIPHIFREDLYGYRPLKPAEKTSKFIIRYLGNFYGKRNPKSFLEALKSLPPRSLDKIQVEFYGRSQEEIVNLIQEFHLQNIAFQKKPVSYLESLSLMATSDLLLVIDAPFENSPFLPSKLVDYIGANKPIFGITPPGTSQKLIEAMGFLVAHPNNLKEISKKLASMIQIAQSDKSSSMLSHVRDHYKENILSEKIRDCVNERQKL